MCNKKVDCLSESDLQSECPIDQQQHLMDSPTLTPGSVPSSNEENPRVKFLCSFSGSILPRPQDGKLRYVGGETRIVSVPRDITYEDLMAKMRELFEGATVLKYQQPDEDLDALVSVVNDDDVTNMMEEYDKLGAGDGFTRLRIFLFSQSDQDGSVHFGDGDERDNERRYVDALNSLNESPEFRRQQPGEFQVMGPLEDVHFAEQYINHTSLESGLHNQRNFEMPMAQINLRHLRIPHLGSGQPQQSVSQRYNDMEAPWSPAYYSPRQPGTHDPRPVAEFPTSPSSGRYHMPYGEFSDKSFDRMSVSEEYNRHQLNHPPLYEHPPQYTDNVVFLPAGPVASEKAGFPGNILHGSSVFEGNSICEHCRTAFHRNQAYTDSPWKPGEQPHMESPNIGNGLHQVSNICAECPPNRDIFLSNMDANKHHPYYVREQTDLRPLYNETHCHDGGWNLQHHSHPQAEEPRHVSVAGRLPDHYIADNGVPLGHGNTGDRHHMPLHRVHPEDPRYMLGGPDLGNQVFHDQAMAGGSPIHVPPVEERVVRYGNPPYAYGVDNVYQVHHGHLPSQPLWRNVHSPINGGPYDASGSPQLANGSINPGFTRITLDSPRLRAGVDSQNPWVESSQKKLGVDGSPLPENSCGQSLTMMPNAYGLENHPPYTHEPTKLPSDILNLSNPIDPVMKSATAALVNDKSVLTGSELEPNNENNVSDRMEEKIVQEGEKETKEQREVEDLNTCNIILAEQNGDPFDRALSESFQRNGLGQPTNVGGTVNREENSACAPLAKAELPDDRLSFVPELIASMKKATLESVKEVKAKVHKDDESIIEHHSAAKEAQQEPDAVDTNGDVEIDSDNDNITSSKIEPTKAEEEAIKRGLQTIRNEDLEEIRELGSGTYGSVFHGKWKGSDVAIKRIKASCFAGRPSERERLIADFWKEALILSSLHHPNVVSFYGVVRDGPDGSLATVTEFMVNGSLKQFLQKKDRTIDRRKRLIIAMDAAFGMEYLHGKNIVHFDLKCENLLVNMRDPHRPVCKIGDLGLSKVKQHTLVSGGVRGTLPWMAPELLSGKSNMVTEKIDVYSFGIVMWELLTGDEPYADMHCANIIGGIVNNTLRPQIPTWCDPEWKSLMETCWAPEPAQRLSFSEISQKLRNMAAAINVK